jgi:tRNA (guanine-N7-)-methyltransferase
VGKNKIARWAEMKSFGNVIEPQIDDIRESSHVLKGKWKKTVFKNDHPLVLELGCGKGEYTVGLAARFTEKNFIGIDIKGARIWRGAKTARENQYSNVHFLRTRIEFINSFFAEDEADEIWITFPDPFPRQRDEARRLTSPQFLNLYRLFLRNSGIVHLKTDNHQLYLYTLALVKKNGLRVITSTDNLYSGLVENEILSIRTHYENLFLKEGKKINYLSFSLEKNFEITNEGGKRQL